MIELRIGDRVTFRERAYVVRGMSPMGVLLRSVQLEDVVSGERVDAYVDDLDDGATLRPADRLDGLSSSGPEQSLG